MSEIITSFHGIEETLKDPPAESKLYVGSHALKRTPRVHALAVLAKTSGVPVLETGEEELIRLAEGREQRGVILVLSSSRKVTELSFDDFLADLSKEEALVVVLDGITDPQNYGAILRSADQFGADLVVIPARRSAQDTPAVFAASSGAAAWVPHTVVPNLTRVLEKLKEKEFWIYGADMNGTPAAKAKMSGRVVLVLGSEGKGLSRLVKETCDFVVSIPTVGKLDSLNVSVAAGVLMYEVVRSRG